MNAQLANERRAALSAKTAWEQAHAKAARETNPQTKKELQIKAHQLHAVYVAANVRYQLNNFVS
jgi:nucleoid DNA-binding protein